MFTLSETIIIRRHQRETTTSNELQSHKELMKNTMESLVLRNMFIYFICPNCNKV